MPRHVVFFSTNPGINFYYGRFRKIADGYLHLSNARVYDGPRSGDSESPTAVAFRLANTGPVGGTSAPVPRMTISSQGCVLLDVTTGAMAAWEGASAYDVALLSFGTNKIAVIKAVRGLNGTMLKEAKDLVEAASAGAPQIVRRNLSPNDAKAAMNELRAIGAIARIAPSGDAQ